MKRLNLYITKQLVVTALIAVGVLTFVLLSANLMDASGLLAKGLGLGTLFKFTVYIVPYLLAYAIPLAWLCASVLVFSWLSAGHEISAMRASGISLWQIVSPALILSILLSVGCVVLQSWLVPACNRKAQQLESGGNLSNPARVLEPGRFVKFADFVIYTDRKEGNQLRGVHIYALDEQGRVHRDITARKGRIESDPDKRKFYLRLKDATIITSETQSQQQGKQDSSRTLAGRDARIPLKLGQEQGGGRLIRDLDQMSMKNLMGAVHVFADSGRDVTPVYVELHTRLSLALSPFALLLVGIPCGIRTRRRETSIGLAVSLFLALFFYGFMVLAEGLDRYPALHPEFFAWVPNVLYQVGGLCGIIWISRH